MAPTEDRLEWIPIYGAWTIENKQILFPGESQFFGLALANRTLNEGDISVDVTISPPDFSKPQVASLDTQAAQSWQPVAHIVLAWSPHAKAFLSAGIGVSGALASVSSWSLTGSWTSHQVQGFGVNVEYGRRYHMRVAFAGQRIRLWLDGVELVSYQAANILTGGQVGLAAYNNSEVRFENFAMMSTRQTGFVAMAFDGTFDGLYRDVLQPVATSEGLTLVRADEIPGPGFIIQDIIQNLYDATVIVAEITSPNPNVYFELGYAYAMGKPIVLLARRDLQLPFDVAGMRVIFYEDSIDGKGKVENEFRQHLRAILMH